MLTKIRLKNFKAFKDTGDITVAPITVLTGPNGSGKSAIIRAMMALRQTVESRDLGTAFVSTGPYVDLGPYEDMVQDHDLKARVGIEFEVRISPMPTRFFGMDFDADIGHEVLSASLELAYLKTIDRIYLTNSTVAFAQGMIKIRKETLRDEQLGRSYCTFVDFTDRVSTKLADSQNARFYGIPSFQISSNQLTEDVNRETVLSESQVAEFSSTQFARLGEDAVVQELSGLRYIGPLRAKPERIYSSTGQKPTEVGTTGEAGPAVLWSASEAKEFDLIKLSQWCERMGLALKVELVSYPGGFFRLMLVDTHTEVAITIADAGFGASQLLPILIQGLIAPEGGTMLLEQPEIHLHPKAQADLADFLVEVSRRGVGVIVETHSEHLLTRLRRRIAEESLDRSHVALYYVTRSEEGSQVTPVEINEYGQVPDAPQGFFAEGFNETFDILEAVGDRKMRESQAPYNG